MARQSRPRTLRSALALLALLAPAATLAVVAAPPASAGALCGTPLANGDCTAPEAEIYRAREGDESGADDIAANGTTTSDEADFYVRIKNGAADPDVKKITYSCRLEKNGSVAKDWQDCTAPSSPTATASLGHANYTDLGVGSYTVSVKASDAADNGNPLFPAPAPNQQADPGTQWKWTVVEATTDTTPPQTRIVEGAKRWHLFPYLQVSYTADDKLKSAACTLNGRSQECSANQATLWGLTGGDWKFTVAGTNAAGLADATPATNLFTVPVSSTKLRASKGWSKGGGSGYFMSTYSSTKKKGATLSAARAGTRAVALVVTRCRGCGTVTVSYGGKVLKKVSLAATGTRKRQLVPIASWGSAHGGRVTVKVVSSGKPVTVEGLGFSKRR
jgi:hypothetical protein